MLHMLYMHSSKVLTNLLFQVQCSRQLSHLKLSSLMRLCFSLGSPIFQHSEMLFFRSPRHLYLHLSIWPPVCQCSAPPHLCLQTPYPSSVHFVIPLSAPSSPPMTLAVFLHLLLPLPPRTRSGFFNGMPEVFDPEVPNFYTIPRSIL